MDFLPLLPRDIVFNHIINLLDFTSRVRAAAVSPAWRDLLRAAPCTPGSPLPWLWDESRAGKGNPFLIDVASFTFIRSSQRPFRDEHVVVSGSIYLTFPGDPSERPFRIWDPFTGDSYQLPCTFRDPYGMVQPLRDIWSIQLSSRLPNCVIAALSDRGLYLCRPGDKDWVEGLISMSLSTVMNFRKGLFYCLDPTRSIGAYDFTYMVDYLNGRIPYNPTLHRRQVAPSINDLHSYAGGVGCRYSMVDSDGELFVVGIFDLYNEKRMELTVHRVDEEKGEYVRVKDLGDRMLFVGPSTSRPSLVRGQRIPIVFSPRIPSIFSITHRIVIVLPSSNSTLKFAIITQDMVSAVAQFGLLLPITINVKKFCERVHWFAPVNESNRKRHVVKVAQKQTTVNVDGGGWKTYIFGKNVC